MSDIKKMLDRVVELGHRYEKVAEFISYIESGLADSLESGSYDIVLTHLNIGINHDLADIVDCSRALAEEATKEYKSRDGC